MSSAFHDKPVFLTVPFAPRPALKATEQRLEAIYKAAHAGLKGDSLAFAAGLLPVEYRELAAFDPMVETVEAKARADSEMGAAAVIDSAIAGGDAKMALSKLQHLHGWVAKQQIDMSFSSRIDLNEVLERANRRVLDAEWTDVDTETPETHRIGENTTK